MNKNQKISYLKTYENKQFGISITEKYEEDEHGNSLEFTIYDAGNKYTDFTLDELLCLKDLLNSMDI